ncbi:FAD-dependent oxidoreductase, partial [Streptomonospora algeriensis]
GEDFALGLADGRAVRARRILVAAGLVDELPDIPGLEQRWGRDVVHCPYCHGWEVRDRAIGVLATGPMAVHQALLFRQLSASVALLCHDRPAPTGEQAEELAALGIRVIEGEVAEVEVAEDRIAGVRMADGRLVARDVVAVAPHMRARAGFLAGLGLHPVEHPMGMGDYIPAEADGRTAVEGV